jgi:hypothetical protein
VHRDGARRPADTEIVNNTVRVPVLPSSTAASPIAIRRPEAGGSSLRIAALATARPIVALVGAEIVTLNVSIASPTVSPTMGMFTDVAVVLAAIVAVPDLAV